MFFIPPVSIRAADIGGALRLGGTGLVEGCSFFFNEAITRGPAIAMIGPTTIANSSFDGNDLNCMAGSYRHYTEEVKGKHLKICQRKRLNLLLVHYLHLFDFSFTIKLRSGGVHIKLIGVSHF